MRPKIDLGPLVDLIELTVAPGTWAVQDGLGHPLPRKNPHQTIREDQCNQIVPFYLSVSLIIRCPDEVHDDVANLLRGLRRLQNPWGDADDGSYRHLVYPRAEPTADHGNAKPAKSAKSDRQKKMDQLLKELQEALKEPSGDGGRSANVAKTTDLVNGPDVDLVVSESKRILDVGETATFKIRLRNYGTKEATNIQLIAKLSSNLALQEVAGGAEGYEGRRER